MSPVMRVILVVAAANLAPASARLETRFLQRELDDSRVQEEFLARGSPKEQLEGEEGEGGKAIGIHQTVVWKDESDVPKLAQFILAFAWVCMLSSMPFILPVLDHRPVTKTQILVGVSTVGVLFGGFYLFTNVVLFQSIHFDSIRPLTVVECTYFMAQTITTIGYGDIGPAKMRGQIFVGIYVVFSLFVIAMVISDVTEHMIKVAHEIRETRLKRQETAAGLCEPVASKTVQSLIAPPKPSFQPLLNALAVFICIDVLWVLFYSSCPGEGKTVFQAFYMSLITLGAVGFGFFTPVTEAGMIFASFFMVLGCGTLVVVIARFTQLMVQFNDYERFNPAEGKMFAMGRLKEMANGSNSVTAMQFLQFSLMESQKVTKAEIDDILEVFESMQPKDGSASLDAIQEACSPRILKVHTARCSF